MTLTRLAPPTYQGDQRPVAGTPINWDSKHAQGLVYCWPLWEGGGQLAQELVHGARAINVSVGFGSTMAWRTSSIGTALWRADTASDTEFFAAATRYIPLPMTFTCAMMVPGPTVSQNPIFGHEPVSVGSVRGYRFLVKDTTGVLRVRFNSVADYDSVNGVVVAGHTCFVAVTMTGNGGTIRFALYDTVTGKLSVDGPTSIGTVSAAAPNQPDRFTLLGSDALVPGDELFMCDARVYNRAMSEAELVDLVSPASRWNLFATGTFTKGSVQATVTMDAPPMVFLELDDLPMGNLQLGMPAPPLAFLELDTPPLAAQAIQPFGGIHGVIVSAGGDRGAIVEAG